MSYTTHFLLYIPLLFTLPTTPSFELLLLPCPFYLFLFCFGGFAVFSFSLLSFPSSFLLSPPPSSFLLPTSLFMFYSPSATYLRTYLTTYNLQLTTYNLQLTTYNLQLTTYNPLHSIPSPPFFPGGLAFLFLSSCLY